MVDKELIILITQRVNRNAPKNSPVLLSIDCMFDGKTMALEYQGSNPTLNDLCAKLKEYSGILSSDSKICTFHVPVKFWGLIKDENNIYNFNPPDNKMLKSAECLAIGGRNQLLPVFKERVTFDGAFFIPICFANTNFYNRVKNIARWECEMEFDHCFFHEDADFSNSPLGMDTKQTSTIFDHCTFRKKANFSNSTFGVKTYFHRSTFKDEALFYRSKFSDVANFYFTTFHKAPNFSMCVFNNSKLANFIGVDTSGFDMENIKGYVVEKAKSEDNDYNRFMGRGMEYLKTQHALNIRDSFRTIKETLNAQANVLESQKWHKLELYTKELELECRIKGLEKLRQEVKQF